MGTLAITGATGFLGRALVAECASRGDVQVRVLVRNAATARDLWGPCNVEVCEGDLRNASGLTRFVAGASTVIHLAYLKDGRDQNVKAAQQLAKASLAAGVRRVVHCSTAVVIGPRGSGVVDESFAPAPGCEYEVTKLAIETAFRNALLPEGELVILRPTEIVGPGGEGLRRMIDRLRTKRDFVNMVRRVILRERRLNYVCVRNVVAALLLLAEASLPNNGDVFTISDDDDPDNAYGSVESLVLEALGRGRRAATGLALPLPLLRLAFRLLPRHASPDRVYSSEKIRRLGYRRVTTLRETIKDLVAFELGRRAADLTDGANAYV